MTQKYKHVALGGTFDLLHKGHTTLLEKAFKVSRDVTIGITTDNFSRQSEKLPYENQQARRKNLTSYLKTNNYQKRAKIIWLDDIYGNTQTDTKLQALIVSKETLDGAKQINNSRAKKNLKKLTVIVCPQILASDKKLISSTRIRNGEISKNGLIYSDFLYKISGKLFKEKTRANLKKPFGKIIKINSKLKSASNLVAVGDISVANLLKVGILPKISLVDFYVKRKLTFQNLSKLGFGSANADVIVKNEAGQISKALIGQIEKATLHNRSTVILVDGEEDLATIPAILLAPLGSTVIYGQPDKGAVLVNITPQIKDDLCNILS